MKKYLSIILILFMLCSQRLRASASEPDTIVETPIPPIEYKVKIKNFVLPVALITAGTIASQTDHKDIFHFDRSDYKSKDKPWDYIFLGGVASSMFLFDKYVEAGHQPFDQSMLLAFSAGLTLLPAYLIKENYAEQRPDGHWNSFPSGHAVTAFMIAHVLNKEFKDSNTWLAYSGYVLAAGVSSIRIIQNKHWVCDALAGAGIGILGTEIAYWIYFPVKNFIAGKWGNSFPKNIAFVPSIGNQAFCLNLNIKLATR
jgi:hypothetical protein